jgi:hypothetical protein
VNRFLLYADDALFFLGLVSIVIASYLVNVILGTYVLGVAFLVSAFFAGKWLRSPMAQTVLDKFRERK